MARHIGLITIACEARRNLGPIRHRRHGPTNLDGRRRYNGAMNQAIDLLPGAELVREGVADLLAGRRTAPALLVSIAATRLRRCGLDVPSAIPDADHLLYALLARDHGDDAHSQYNALVRRLVSFEQALECAS